MSQSRKPRYLFYTGMVSIILVILAFGGAAIVQPFRLERYVKPFVIVHILTSMGWLILFTYQSKLVLTGRLERHRKNLQIGTVLVLITTLFSIYITYEWGDIRRFIGESRDVLAFAILFFTSIWAINKGKAETHKRLMLIAMLNLIHPALTRVGVIFGWSVPIAVLVMILIWIIVPIWYDLSTARKIHRATFGGIGFTLASFTFIVIIVTSPLLEKIELLLYGST